jgi:hypothetical protein
MGKLVTLKEAAAAAKVNVKTLRRAIERGTLSVSTVDKGNRGAYMVDLDSVHHLYGKASERPAATTAPERPIDAVKSEIKALRLIIERQTQVIEAQTAKTASIEAELHETKAALFHAMSELQRALPATTAPVRRGFRWPWSKD